MAFRGIAVIAMALLALTQSALASLPRTAAWKAGRRSAALFSQSVRRPLELERRNPHPLDQFVSLDHSTHRYSFRGQPIKFSCTDVLKMCVEEFAKEEIVDRMMNSKNWPRPDYLHGNGQPFTRSEVLEKWDTISADARHQGKVMHHSIEQLLNDEPIAAEDLVPELLQFKQFQREILLPNNISPYRTEWSVIAPDLSLGGSIDFVGKMRHKVKGRDRDSFVLVDWKRSKTLAKLFSNTSPNKFAKPCKPPIAHLEDNQLVRYCLQLNVYRYILKHYYDMDVRYLGLAVFSPDLPKYAFFEAPLMDADVELIMKNLRSLI